jgi:hypothetical protein
LPPLFLVRCCAAGALPLLLLKVQKVVTQFTLDSSHLSLMLLANADAALPLLIKVQKVVTQFKAALLLLVRCAAAAELPLLLLKVQKVVRQFTLKCGASAQPLLLLKVQKLVTQFKVALLMMLLAATAAPTQS